jgi:hypothetical protein
MYYPFTEFVIVRDAIHVRTPSYYLETRRQASIPLIDLDEESLIQLHAYGAYMLRSE